MVNERAGLPRSLCCVTVAIINQCGLLVETLRSKPVGVTRVVYFRLGNALIAFA